MDNLTVSLDLPRNLLDALDVPQEELPRRLRTLVTVALFQEGKISTGKGAEILGISKLEFIQLLAKHGIDYFTESPSELIAEVKDLDSFLKENRP